MQKVTTFFMFNDQAEEAATLYTSLFKNSKITSLSRYGEGAPFPKGTAMQVTFELDGQTYFAFNGGPHFKFSEGLSLFVSCKDQEEVDFYWNKLTTGGGKESMCGWLTDKFGVSWQIIPDALMQLMNDKDPVKAGRVVQAMFKMKKIVIKDLQDAYDGK